MAFCDENGIPYEICGKVVVATTQEELPRLDELQRRGLANGLQGLEIIGPERLKELEPHAIGIKGLYVPETGIIDYKKVAAAYADKFAMPVATFVYRKKSSAFSIDPPNSSCKQPAGTIAPST
jgi:L-2-hydroxyglutarate oxidase LhgO